MKFNNNRCVVLVAAALCGCTAGVKTPTGAGGTSGTPAGSAGSSGRAGGGGSTGAAGSTGNTSGGVDASLNPDAACATTTAGAVSVPLDLYFLMDSSKSMLDATGAGTSKWDAIGKALKMFFDASPGLGVALKYFPDEQSAPPASCTMDSQCTVGGTSYGACDRRQTCVAANNSTSQVTPLCVNAATDCNAAFPDCVLIQTCGANGYCAAGPSAPTNACAGCTTFPGYCHLRDICTSSKYATPDVPMLTLPDTTGMLSNSLMGHTPDGYTPTGPALAGAVAFAQARQASNPDHKVAIVLVTDGLPGGFLPGFPPAECAPSDIPGISSLAMAAATGTPPILTFVVGIFNPASAEGIAAPANLMSLATAGGTGSAVIIDVTQSDVTQKLQAALAQAQTKAIACSYQIPPPSHGTVDFGKVNVQYTNGAGAVTTIGHTTSKAACSAGGWYYDIDPSAGKPTKIIACDSTCSQFQNDVSGHVEIVLGCATIVIDTGI